ncbi:hypothetical protein [Streptomyces sp. GC420]|uniref:hypothetical protein n=1 Tax=Streptomyces sp. GC420 TaxID=2697568 RepID=UPI0014151207|nr:hypothetical protein [Streptomyces sp. GC420]
MPGDETQLTGSGSDASRVSRGPRHAAPRKSLLTKIQMPAGKAMALAAMPTAVFVTLGLTPRLALADDPKDIPFAPGPCVTQSDEPEREESASPSASPSASASAEPTPEPSPSAGSGTDGGASEPQPGETPSAAGTTEAAGQSAPKTTEPTPTPSASASETTNPLDPLGVGDALKDLFGIEDEETAEPTPTPSATQTETPDTGGPDSGDTGDSTDSGTGSGSSGSDSGTKDDAPSDETADKIKEAAAEAGEDVEELDDSVKDTEENPLDETGTKDADGKEPFPCPTADPKALAAADLEGGLPDLPDDPWILESSMLTLRGLDYEGIVEVRTGSGKIKKALKFTADSIDIKDLHQLVVGPEGKTAHVQADKGSTSTIRDGKVTMYTEELKGNLFGLIPITFSPETPPPLNVPFAFFTDVKVTQAGQFGGTLTVPGLHNYFTG